MVKESGKDIAQRFTEMIMGKIYKIILDDMCRIADTLNELQKY